MYMMLLQEWLNKIRSMWIKKAARFPEPRYYPLLPMVTWNLDFMHSKSLKINADSLFDAGLSRYTMDGIPLSQLQLCYTTVQSVTGETKCINLIV